MDDDRRTGNSARAAVPCPGQARLGTGRTDQRRLHLVQQQRIPGAVGTASVVVTRTPVVERDRVLILRKQGSARPAVSSVALFQQLAELRDRVRIVYIDARPSVLQSRVQVGDLLPAR